MYLPRAIIRGPQHPPVPAPASDLQVTGCGQSWSSFEDPHFRAPASCTYLMYFSCSCASTHPSLLLGLSSSGRLDRCAYSGNASGVFSLRIYLSLGGRGGCSYTTGLMHHRLLTSVPSARGQQAKSNHCHLTHGRHCFAPMRYLRAQSSPPHAANLTKKEEKNSPGCRSTCMLPAELWEALHHAIM